MNLKLERPLICFDLETTGLNPAKDFCVSISLIKLFPDGSKDTKSRLVRPPIPIPKQASDVHGITDEMVENMPSFKSLSKGLFDFMKGCDLLSYNGNNFDIPLLAEEFLRCEINFPEEDVKSIDACYIFKKTNPRTLVAALEIYCGEGLEDAHNSLADAEATLKVFLAQHDMYEELNEKSVEEMAEFSRQDNRVDLVGKILIDSDGDYIYNIGENNRGKKIKDDVGFGNWMLSKDFTLNTKAVLSKILKDIQDAK